MGCPVRLDALPKFVESRGNSRARRHPETGEGGGRDMGRETANRASATRSKTRA
jgi:hypothetical protein